MLSVLKQTLAPLLSLFIFELGNGFFPTLLALQLSSAHVSEWLIGFISGAFYGGLLLGSIYIETIILRIGHIRAFAAFASALTALCMLHGMIDNVVFWVFLRFTAGIATAGVFVVIESWLLCVSSPSTRGQILSLYMISFYASQALGQFILSAPSTDHLFLFAITAMLCSVSVIPLAMTRVYLPEYGEPAALGFRQMYQKTASGLIGAFCAGLILGSLYALLPVLLHQLFSERSMIANYMFLMIFGGMVLQYPIGKLSDVIERRLVLIFICLGIIGVSMLMEIFLAPSWQLMALMTFFGGLTFTLYPVSISYACDSLDANQIVEGTQALLIAYSIGAMTGPLMAPGFIKLFDIKGLFIFIITVCTVLAIFLFYRKTQHSSVPQEEPFRSVPQTTLVVTELDPRQDA